MTAGLSRDVLRWLQTLELSLTFPNPRNDFSNGYLVAEILNRYYPRDIYPGRFINGTSIACKMNNWGQIKLFLKKHQLKVSNELCDAVMHKIPRAVSEFLDQLCVILSGKQMTKANIEKEFNSMFLMIHPNTGADTIPHYALPTAARMLKVIPNSKDVTDKDEARGRIEHESIVTWHRDFMHRTGYASVLPLEKDELCMH